MVTDIIFDLDGTIFDTKDSVLGALKKALKSQNCDVNIKNIEATFGLTLDDQIKALITNKSSDFYKKVKLEFINQYDSFFCVKCNFYPGLLETLKTLQKRKINIHLVTNKRLAPSVKILKHFKIMSCFYEYPFQRFL